MDYEYDKSIYCQGLNLHQIEINELNAVAVKDELNITISLREIAIADFFQTYESCYSKYDQLARQVNETIWRAKQLVTVLLVEILNFH